ncbi:DUF2742 domain-containing protein [Mycobacterium sherrisii]|uniref:DUF2742 domain-containing protein n=1 Tax=Mycobacterium sherrisii TaxID=243061 RepID=UPI002DDCC4B3|nr:DUF2742 domain-containing protein [Mycobacterium sherrisii]MEC4763357.1 DUF2742 domain-containing protein [Mycobacterium sherrisii]
MTPELHAKEAGPARAGSPASELVYWWPVHKFVEAVVAQANIGPLPVAGTPTWRELADGDPRKLLALAVAGEHHVLRVETAQQARADASKTIAANHDWSSLARSIRNRDDAYIPRRRSA